MTFLLAWTLRAAATVAIGLLLAFALRRRSAATRNLVLRATLAVALALPAVAAFAPRIEVAPPPVAFPAVVPVTPAPRAVFVPTPVTEGWSFEADDPSRPATYGLVERTPLSSRFVSLPLLILAVWLGGTGLLVLRWLVGLTRLVRLSRKATSYEAPDVWCAAVPVPATYGRTILLPLESDAWPESRRRAAILHERAHVARHDWRWQTLAALFAAVHWPNPLAWFLLRSLRDTAEAAADDAALAHMAPSDYARELLAVAKATGPVGPALAMARRGGVHDRVVAVLASRLERRAPTRRVGTLVFVALAGAGIALAGIALSQNHAVELVRVLAKDATGRIIAWDASGVLASTTDSRPDSLNPKGWGLKPDERMVGIDLHIARETAAGLGTDFHVAAPATTLMNGPVMQQGPDVTTRLVVSVPRDMESLNVTVGVADGTWHSETVKPQIDRSPIALLEGKPSYRIFVPLRDDHDETRLRLYNRAGKRMAVFMEGHLNPPALNTASYRYSALNVVEGDPKNLGRVVLERRPYRWTTLRNVALNADPKAASKIGTKVRIVAVQTFDAKGDSRKRTQDRLAWSPNGTPLSTTERLEMRGDRSAPTGYRTMMLQLHVSGDPRDVVAKVLPWGSHSVSFDLPQKRPLKAVLWDVPAGRFEQDVRLAVASGPWKTYTGDLHFALGHHQQTWLEFDFPKALLGKNIRLVAILKNGRRTTVASYNHGPDGPAVFPTVPGSGRQGWLFDGADDVRGIELDYRDYETTVFPKVALRPRSASSAAATAYRTQPFGRTRTAELLSVFDATKAKGAAWRPDGARLPDVPNAYDPGSNRIGWRRLGFAVQVKGPTIRQAYSEASGWPRYGTGTGYPDQIRDDKPTLSRTLVSNFPVPDGVARGDVRLDLVEGPATVHFATERNARRPVKVERISTVESGEVEVTLPRAIRIPADRKTEVVAYDGSGRVLSNSDGRLRTDGILFRSLRMWLPHPERIARWEVRSRAFSTVTFRGVNYRPNP